MSTACVKWKNKYKREIVSSGYVQIFLELVEQTKIKEVDNPTSK